MGLFLPDMVVRHNDGPLSSSTPANVGNIAGIFTNPFQFASRKML